MKRKMLNITALILFVTTTCYAQVYQSTGKVDANPNPAGIIAVKELPPAKIVGSNYLTDYWNLGTVYMKDDLVIENYPLKYDIENQRIEIKTEQDVKVLSIDRIKTIKWMDQEKGDRTLINADSYSENDVPLIGMFEVLHFGDKYQLYSKTDLSVKKAYYNQALDAGTRDDEILRKESLWLSNGTRIFPMTGKKDLLDFCGDNADAVKSYMKSEKLTHRNQAHIVMVLAYLESI